MSMEAIKTITAAEAQARAEKAQAQQDAQAAVANAEKSAAQSMADAQRRAEQEIAALMRATEEKAEANARELLHNTANKCAALHARGETRLDSAAEFIVRRVVDG